MPSLWERARVSSQITREPFPVICGVIVNIHMEVYHELV